jgi:hypothetical protein
MNQKRAHHNWQKNIELSFKNTESSKLSFKKTTILERNMPKKTTKQSKTASRRD